MTQEAVRLRDRGRIAARVARWALPALCTLGVYANALHNPFISDDSALIGENIAVVQPTISHLRTLWTISYTEALDRNERVVSLFEEDPNGDIRTVYRPITTSTYWLTSLLSGMDPLAFRLGNVALHALAATVLGGWAATFFGDGIGLLVALVIALHPLATDVVNRISGRADILMLLAVGGILTTQCRAREYGWTWARTALVFLLAIVAFGSKESAVIVIPLAVLQNISGRPRDGTWRFVLALGAPLLLYGALRGSVLHWAPYVPVPQTDLFDNPLLRMSTLDRAPAFGSLALHYLRLLFVPWPLLGFDSPVSIPTWNDAAALAGLAFVAMLSLVGTWLVMRRRSPLGISIGWFLATLVVFGHIVTPVAVYHEVRFAYEFLGAFALLVGWAMHAAVPGSRAWRIAGLAAFALLTVGYAGLTVARNPDFASLGTLLRADFSHRPDGAATVDRMARMADEERRWPQAEELYRKTLQLAPWSSQAKEDLAVFLARQGKMAEAKSLWQAAVRDNASPTAMLRLGTLAIDTNDFATARELLTRAANLTPRDKWIAYNRAVLEDHLGNKAEAIQRLESLIAEHPDFAPARVALQQLQ
jgi:tetratricopeptide (TPR) repeat protein